MAILDLVKSLQDAEKEIKELKEEFIEYKSFQNRRHSALNDHFIFLQNRNEELKQRNNCQDAMNNCFQTNMMDLFAKYTVIINNLEKVIEIQKTQNVWHGDVNHNIDWIKSKIKEFHGKYDRYDHAQFYRTCFTDKIQEFRDIIRGLTDRTSELEKYLDLDGEAEVETTELPSAKCADIENDGIFNFVVSDNNGNPRIDPHIHVNDKCYTHDCDNNKQDSNQGKCDLCGFYCHTISCPEREKVENCDKCKGTGIIRSDISNYHAIPYFVGCDKCNGYGKVNKVKEETKKPKLGILESTSQDKDDIYLRLSSDDFGNISLQACDYAGNRLSTILYFRTLQLPFGQWTITTLPGVDSGIGFKINDKHCVEVE